MKYLVIILLLCFITSCNKKKMTSNIVNIKKNSIDTVNYDLVKMFEETMRKTSFTALVEHYKVESFPIIDIDSNDDFSEKRLIFYANVIEQFKGNYQKKISYQMIVEGTEEFNFDKKIKIICLCKNDDGLFWPGTGSSFPNKNFIIKKAKEIKQNFSNEDSEKTICSD